MTSSSDLQPCVPFPRRALSAAGARRARRPASGPLRLPALATAVGLLVAWRACPAAADPVPAFDHVIVVVMENKTYDEACTGSYTASLISQFSSFSQSYGVAHPSQPSYLALWSGSTQGTVDDNCPAACSPFAAENLGHACEAAGLAWRAYCENLPSIGSPACFDTSYLYARKHAPWTDFSNLSHSNELPFAWLAVDESLKTLPRLAFVIPNLLDDTHDSTVAWGDDWLSMHVPQLLAAGGPGCLLILTWDEDDGTDGNHILTLFAGPEVKPGYVSSRTITHYTVLRTICAALGLPAFGAAAAESVITDVWAAPVTAVAPAAADGPRLSGPRPNPSSGETTAELSLPGRAFLDAAIYDAGGRRVRELLQGAGAGTVRLVWDGREGSGVLAPAGVYFLRVRLGARTLERRVIRVR